MELVNTRVAKPRSAGRHQNGERSERIGSGVETITDKRFGADASDEPNLHDGDCLVTQEADDTVPSVRAALATEAKS